MSDTDTPAPQEWRPDPEMCAARRQPLITDGHVAGYDPDRPQDDLSAKSATAAVARQLNPGSYGSLPDAVVELLFLGRQELARARHEDFIAHAKAAEHRLEVAGRHWAAMILVARRDIPPALWRYSNLREMPEGWQGAAGPDSNYAATCEFVVQLTLPGSATVGAAYRYTQVPGSRSYAWAPEPRAYGDSYDHGPARRWWVALHDIGYGEDGDNIVTLQHQGGWFASDSLALCLAIAEEEGRRLAAIGADCERMNEQRTRRQEAAAERAPVSVEERLLQALADFVLWCQTDAQ